jgi:cytochrome c-type biogenesis protein CcmH/NrfG
MNGLFRQRHWDLMSNAGYSVLAFLLLFAAVSPRAAVLPTAGKAPAAALKRDTELCSAQANIGACYDAIRWNPNDPALLVSLGDALVRAKRPQDAVRSYRRAAVLAPGMGGLAAKITAAETASAPKRASARPVTDRAAGSAPADKRYSNAAPESQSH